MSYTMANIHDLLYASFSDEEFDQFCYNHFRDVYYELSSHPTRSRKIQTLVSYCQQHHQMDALLDHIRSFNPKQYNRFISSDDHETLKHDLGVAHAVLDVLEQQAANYALLTMPASLKIQLEKQRKQIASLENRLAQLEAHQDGVIPDNLPMPPGIFVGRIEETKRCMEALSPTERGWGAVIDGVAGMGKTSLALKVAQKARRNAWFDAYLFVSSRPSLAVRPESRADYPLDTPLDTFVREFARLLRADHILHITNADERRSAFLDALRGRRTLLIWDNLEVLSSNERRHIAEFILKLPAPNKVIITTHSTASENAFTIRLDRLIHMESLSEPEALDLMNQVTRRYSHMADEVSRREISVRRSLYRIADGHPIIINWAMGLVALNTHTLPQAVEQLQESNQSPHPAALLFTRLLRTLSQKEQTILLTLAAFHQPATTRTITEACGQGVDDVHLALEKLHTLHLIRDVKGGHYLLQTLSRTFIHAALGIDHPEYQEILAPLALDPAHYRAALSYWVSYTQTHGGDVKEDQPSFDYLRDAWLNIESAASQLRYLAGHDEPLKDEAAARMLNELAIALRGFLRFRGYWDEWKELSECVYKTTLALGDWHSAGWRAYDIAFIYLNRAETSHAALWARRMTEDTERSGNRRDGVIATRLCGLVAEQRSDLKEAERLFTQALAACRELGEESDEASLLNDLGEIYKHQHDFANAERYYRQALTIAEKRDDKEVQAIYAGNLGLLALGQGQLAEARTWYEQQHALARKEAQPELIAQSQIGLARVLEREKDYAAALPLAEEALKIREQLRHYGLEGTRELVARLQTKVSNQQRKTS